MSVRTLRAGELAEHVQAWRRLAETALEPNVFYEPCMLLPAIEHLAADSDLEFVVVTAPSRKYPDRPPVWCGLFPLEQVRKRRGRLGYRQLWRYLHCFLCTPLVREDVASEVLTAFFEWLDNDTRGRSLLKLDWVSGDGLFHVALAEALHRLELRFWLATRHSRALFRRAADSEAFLLQSMPRKRRHEIRRLAKRFAEQGHAEYTLLERADDLDAWVDEFLDLESRGWKGHSGTALTCSGQDRGFFRDMAERAFDTGQLMLMSLRLNGRVIAQKCNLTTGAGGFAFKIAFDEAFAKFSPGVLLESHNIEALHDRGHVLWMDSCGDPDHPMINHLWKDRRIIESLWIAGKATRAQLALSLMPVARLCRDSLRFSRRTNKNRPLAKEIER